MSTATLPGEARRNVALFSQTFTGGSSFKMERQVRPNQYASGEPIEMLVIENMPVFRAGTFRDSMGFQHTWEDIHMQHMVEHFSLLASRGILEHVPIRKGHPGFFTSGGEIQDSIVGYHTALRVERMVNPVDGIEYAYLLADYEILDPDAIVKIERGLWRNMSAEVGTWFTNDEAEFWPVYQGVAYVDFSAVEGLKNYASANGVGSSYSIMTDKELSVADAPNSTVQVPQPPAGVPVPPVVPPAVSVPPPSGSPVAEHSRPAAPYEFTLANGTKTTDFAAVQAELSTLGQFKKESIESGRKLFAKSLVDSNKMLAKDLKAAEDYCLSLSDEQFTAYKALMDGVPASPVLGVHGEGTTNHSGTQTTAPGQVSEADKQIDTDLGMVEQFKLSGMKADQIKATPAFSRLTAAGRAPAL